MGAQASGLLWFAFPDGCPSLLASRANGAIMAQTIADCNLPCPLAVHGERYLQKDMTMKKMAIVLAAAATLLTSVSVSAPAAAASWDWGFSSPLLSYHHDRSVGSRHLSGRDSVRVGPWRWSGSFGLSADRHDRCAARYRSYDSATGTYVTFGGERKRCRL